MLSTFFICSKATIGGPLWKWVFSGVSQDSRGNFCERRSSVEVGVLGGFKGFTRELLCRGLFFNKATRLEIVTLLKGSLWRGCFYCGFRETFGSVFYIEHL